jgi:hypothetical protein
MNQKKLRRLYAEEKLQVRRRGGRKRALGTRRPIEAPRAENQRWSLDFASDAFTDGRRFARHRPPTNGGQWRALAVVDDFTRECLALVPDTSLSGTRVARELDAVIAARGRPKTCVSDDGAELVSMAVLAWTQERGVDWRYVAPGRPTQNVRSGLGPVAPRRSPSRASWAGYGTSCSTRRSSPRSARPAPCWPPGAPTTTPPDRTRRWETSRPQNSPRK